MGLDIFFSEDIRNALLAANEASSATAAVVTEATGRPPDISLRAYLGGYRAALSTLALAFGLSPHIFSEWRETQVHVPMHLPEMLDEQRIER